MEKNELKGPPRAPPPKQFQLLGRTLGSWLKILLFFCFFYCCLAGYVLTLLIIFFQQLDAKVPFLKMSDGNIGSSPGIGYRPFPSVDYSLIWFQSGHNESVEFWSDQMVDFLRPYELQSPSRLECMNGTDLEEWESCAINMDLPDECNLNTHFGYDTGNPCIAFKLNRIYNWMPVGFKTLPGDFPFENYDRKQVYISCRGYDSFDRENIGSVKYITGPGIEEMYFPFRNQVDYLSPLVFVAFNNLTKGVIVKIECRGWAKNILYDRKHMTGSVSLFVLAD